MRRPDPGAISAADTALAVMSQPNWDLLSPSSSVIGPDSTLSSGTIIDETAIVKASMAPRPTVDVTTLRAVTSAGVNRPPRVR